MSGEDPFVNFRPGATAYQAMSKEEIERDMNARYNSGRAYPDTRLWVHVYHEEVEKIMALLIRDFTRGKDILELGCGGAGIAAFHVSDAKRIIATDLSEIALQKGRDFFKDRPELKFIRMDAEVLDITEEFVDIVIAKEVVEHLLNPEACLREIYRVLRPGGIFVFSTPNRDSLHLRLNRALGRTDFMCSGDHIREFTFSEMTELLACTGFHVTTEEGVMLMPYHFVEGVFPPEVEALEANHEDFVSWLRILGHRAGPEFSFGYIIVASKPASDTLKDPLT